MPPATVLRHPLSQGWGVVLLLLLSPVVSAQSLLCGTFKDADSGTRLQLESPVQGRLLAPGVAPEPYNLEQLGESLVMASLATGSVSALQIASDGRVLASDDHRYTLESAAECRPASAFASGSCRADIAQCIDDMTRAGPERWRQWCREDVPVACNLLIEDYRSDARNDLMVKLALASDREEPPTPAACEQGTASYDRKACEQAETASRARDIGWAFSLAGSTPHQVPLPAEQLDEVSTLCREHPSASFCHATAVALWASKRLLPARDALQLACRVGQDPQACSAATPLASLSPADLAVAPLDALPCGRFQAQAGDLVFGEDGQIRMAAQEAQPAALRDGAVHVRSGKGEDRVFWQLANGDLVANDRDNRFTRYQRDGSAPRCVARAGTGTGPAVK
ncbi:TPA: hypothetical protein UM046_000960 [Stenotrophomonas maltophilia]|nr:hypothetical protein [Stenotrophomonas maltophilia]